MGWVFIPDYAEFFALITFCKVWPFFFDSEHIEVAVVIKVY